MQPKGTAQPICHMPDKSPTAITPLDADQLQAVLARSQRDNDWAWLHIGAAHSTVWRQPPRPSAPSQHALPLGYDSLAARYLRHTPPTEGDVENTIMVVEDAVMPLTQLWPTPSASASLVCTGMAMPALAALLPAEPSPTANAPLTLYSTHALEDLFNQFANVAMGGPSSQWALSNEDAAFLTMLRECMHHWGFQTLAVVHGSPTAPLLGV